MHEGWINSLVQRIKPKDAFTWFSILFFLACMLLSLFLWFEKKKPETTFIQELQQCAKNTDGDIQLVACTREVASSRLNTHRTSDLMIELATSSIPTKYSGCHGIAHIIGEETYNKYENVERAVSECTSDCYAGCLHGVIAGAVKAEYGSSDPGVDIAHMDLKQIEKIGIKYCARPGLCHGIGHVLYYITNDFQKASEGCDAISKHYARETCFSGVFMQGIGGLRDALVLDASTMPPEAKPQNDYAYPCDVVSPPYQHACFLYLPRYQSISFEANGIADPLSPTKIAKDICGKQTGHAQAYCYEGMGQYAPYYNSNTTSTGFIKNASILCQDLPTQSAQKSCILGYINILRGYGFNKRAYDFCPKLSSSGLQTFCYFANFSFFGPSSSSIQESFCKYASEKDACDEALSTYSSKRTTLPDYRFGLYGETP